MKVIANVLNSISIFTFTYGLFNKKEPLPMNKEQFSSWLVGFIDGMLRPSGPGGRGAASKAGAVKIRYLTYSLWEFFTVFCWLYVCTFDIVIIKCNRFIIILTIYD